jgi:hypothetical protein
MSRRVTVAERHHRPRSLVVGDFCRVQSTGCLFDGQIGECVGRRWGAGGFVYVIDFGGSLVEFLPGEVVLTRLAF